MFSLRSLLLVAGLLCSLLFVAAEPEHELGDVVQANPGHYLNADGEKHPLSTSGLGLAAGDHPAIISGPAVDHPDGGKMYPVIPVSKNDRVRGVNNERPKLEDFNKNGAGSFVGHAYLGEGVHVKEENLSKNTRGGLMSAMHPKDHKTLREADATANANRATARTNTRDRSPRRQDSRSRQDRSRSRSPGRVASGSRSAYRPSGRSGYGHRRSRSPRVSFGSGSTRARVPRYRSSRSRSPLARGRSRSRTPPTSSRRRDRSPDTRAGGSSRRRSASPSPRRRY